jgi:hypothetical protein
MKTNKTQVKPQVILKTKELGSRGANQRPVHLYWVTTDDHSEDWFIFAHRRRSAESYHENYEGYRTYDASARNVLTNVNLTEHVNGPLPRHAQVEDLQALGFEIVDSPKFGRAVRFRGELFAEGCMEALVREADDNLFEAAGKGRPNGTKPGGRI